MNSKNKRVNRRLSFWLVLIIWILCAGLGFVLTSLWINPHVKVFFNKDYWSALAGIEKSLRLVHHEYVDRNKSNFDNLKLLAINGMVEGLDRHSQFFDKTQYKNFQDNTKRRYVGIGIMIRKNPQGVMVTRVFENSPASSSGLKIGDIITHVNGHLIRGQELEEVSEQIKGVAATEVAIRLLTNSENSQQLLITRQEIKISSVDGSKIDENGTAYLRIVQFTETSGKEVNECLQMFQEKGLKRLIIDLRDNSGGLLLAALELVELFVPAEKLILSVKGSEPMNLRKFKSSKDGPFVDLPLAILINEKSASASEIVAGSLSKSKRALLVGEKSFGKGSVQTIFPLSDGCGMKLTTATYFFSDGSTADVTGLVPDHFIPCSEHNETKLSLQRNYEDFETEETFEERFGFSKIKDEQLQFAKRIIMSVQ